MQSTTTNTKTVWTIDPYHSEIMFKVRHLMVSTVTGSFKSFEGRLETEGDDFENANAYFTADIDSVTTNIEQRDQHLKSADFFNAEEHPKLTFETDSFKKTGSDTYDVTGTLTIKGVSNRVVLKAEYGGQAQDFYGNQKAGFELTGTIKRKEFGLTYDAVTEAGGVVLGDDVKLVLSVQLARQQ